MLETVTVSSAFTFDLESVKLEMELHIRTLNGPANHASKMVSLMTGTRPTVGRSIRLYGLPLSQSNHYILCIFVYVHNNRKDTLTLRMASVFRQVKIW